jgi:hypothetical protein
MTCQECEIELGMGENASEHLASCEECRWLAEELRRNAVALRELRVRPRVQWEWALAAAAAIVMGVGLWMNGAKKPPEGAAAVNIVGMPGERNEGKENKERRLKPTLQAKARATRREQAAAVRQVKRVSYREQVQPLKVKMFTSDPDVVIYWIVDRKESFE